MTEKSYVRVPWHKLCLTHLNVWVSIERKVRIFFSSIYVTAMFTGCVCVQQQAMCGNSPGLVWIMHCIQVARAYSSQPCAAILPVWFGSCSVKVSVCVQQPTMCCNSPISWFGLDHTGCVCVQLAAMCCILLVWFGSCTVCRLRVRTAASHVRHSPGLVWITPPSLTPAFSSPTAAEWGQYPLSRLSSIEEG